MKKQVIVIVTFAFLGTHVKSQVKIGDNPNTINANSILELESTNKGLLLPRVALSSVNSATPLTATTPAGMMVYSTGGALSDGYYAWNGSKWLNFTTGNTTRNNHVIVKSASDLPAASGGVITLITGTSYEINGTIILTSKINLNGCQISGTDSQNDKLVYTGSGELFTGSGTGSIRYLSITSASGKVFNINAGGANKNLLVQNCFFLGCSEVGTIQGVGGTVFFANLAYFFNTNGVTFQNCTNVVLHNTLWDASNSNTYEKFIGSFNIIQILGGDRLVNSANSATAISVAGISSVVNGSIKVVMFTGNGTYISGPFSNAWEVESSGVATEKDDAASGNLYMTAPATTSFAATNVPSKVNGPTIAASLFRMASSTSNRLTYTGGKSKRFQVICSLTGTPSSNNNIYSFFIARNGVVLPESRQSVKMSTTTDQQSVTVSCTVLLAPNDYIELWAENDSNSGNLLITTFNMAAK